jgi:trk system potassium uptake protein TrkH
MSLLDAICHAMSTVSTGGFANYDASFAHFQSVYLDCVAILFMLAGALPFTVYVALTSRKMSRRTMTGLFDDQIRYFLLTCAVISVSVALWLTVTQGESLGHALRISTFNIVSVITTTGFVSADYMQWGVAAALVFFALYFTGGCTGSTAGGVKIFRHQVLFQAIRRILFRMVRPHGVMSLKLNDMPVSEETLASVMAFMFLYAATIFVIGLGISMTGLDLVTSLSAAATAVSNVGPALGDVAGPAGNFASFSPVAKILMSIGMLLGRLELFTIFVLLTPRFWRV